MGGARGIVPLVALFVDSILRCTVSGVTCNFYATHRQTYCTETWIVLLISGPPPP